MERLSLSNSVRRPAPSQLEPRKGSNARDAGTRDAGPSALPRLRATVRSAPGRDRAESRAYTHLPGKDKRRAGRFRRRTHAALRSGYNPPRLIAVRRNSIVRLAFAAP